MAPFARRDCISTMHRCESNDDATSSWSAEVNEGEAFHRPISGKGEGGKRLCGLIGHGSSVHRRYTLLTRNTISPSSKSFLCTVIPASTQNTLILSTRSRVTRDTGTGRDSARLPHGCLRCATHLLGTLTYRELVSKSVCSPASLLHTLYPLGKPKLAARYPPSTKCGCSR